tara:strand:- start:32 stop:502 length:471 start_codon:yes stop_codon:yes gene_type:complete
MKKCVACGKRLSNNQFEALDEKYFRNICKNCSVMERNKSKSKSPISYIRHLYSQLKYSRKKKNPEMEWAIEPEDLIALWKKQKGRCALSGMLMTYVKDGTGRKELNVSIDRIHPHRGYIASNMQLVCHRVNIMKHTLTEGEFWWWCKNIVEAQDEY